MSIIPSRFGLRGKLMAGSAVLLAFTGTVGALGVHDMSSANSNADALFTESVEPLAELGTARAKFNENRAFVNNHILETAAADKAEIEAKMLANVKVIDENLADVDQSLANSPELKAEFDEGRHVDRGLPRRTATRCSSCPRPVVPRRRTRSTRPTRSRRPRSSRRPSPSSSTARSSTAARRTRRSSRPRAPAARARSSCSSPRCSSASTMAFWFSRQHRQDGPGDPRPPADAARPLHRRTSRTRSSASRRAT